jgi:hypothetical protein
VEYEFPEPGEAEAYGELDKGATVARAHAASFATPALSPLVAPLTAAEAEFLGASKAERASAKNGKCATGRIKKHTACASVAPVRYGVVKLAIPTAGTSKFTIRPSRKIRAALKKGKKLSVDVTLVFTPSGTTTPYTETSVVRVHIKRRKHKPAGG